MAAAVRNMSATVFFPRRTPTCEMDCNPHAHGAPTCDARRVAWAKGRIVDHYRGAPLCVRDKIVGFDANPVRAPFSHNDWIAVFTFAGLPPTTKIKAESTSKKLTPEDLRATLLDFGKTAKFLRERRPGLHDQLHDTAHRVFKTINLPGNRTARFEEYEH